MLDLFNLQPSPTLFNYSLDRYSSIIHTRISLDAFALNYYLFKIGCNLQDVLVALKSKL